MDNAYYLLGLERHCSDADIRQAYRQMALLVHPDRYPDDPLAQERFETIVAAKDCLLDCKSRASLDKHLAAKESSAPRHGTGNTATRSHRTRECRDDEDVEGNLLLKQDRLRKKTIEQERRSQHLTILQTSPLAVPNARSMHGGRGSSVVGRSLRALPKVHTGMQR
eukprot:TRINITY_DN37497_c0_g1_i1.p1 TRINITY_DN37497_c0_g1~~TRINITY_DN37497_c0_g1_i1.p1  ORF type:complete len:166 (+),score=27.30 TRINITY_DN37497_c0_g1_i1:54-551(+)